MSSLLDNNNMWKLDLQLKSFHQMSILNMNIIHLNGQEKSFTLNTECQSVLNLTNSESFDCGFTTIYVQVDWLIDGKRTAHI